MRHLVLFALAAASCRDAPATTFHPPDVARAFGRAMQLPPGAVTAIDSLGPREWTALYVFGPYTTDDYMRKCLATSQFESYQLARRDDAYAIYFRSPGGYVSSMTLSRSDVRFSAEALERAFPRGAASFIVRRDSLGGVELAPGTTVRRCG